MTRAPTTLRASDDRLMGRTIGRAVRWAVALWLVVVGLGWLLSRTDMGHRWLSDVRSMDAIAVAIASLLIALTSMIPGWPTSVDATSDTPRLQAGRLVASMVIRIIGTVALFLACRYQMATPIEKLAAMVLGWYVVLTFVEILVLARGMSGSHGPTCGTATRSVAENPAAANVQVRFSKH